MREKEIIIICKSCKGYGQHFYYGPSISEYKTCNLCKGSGRLTKISTYKAYEESST